MKKTWPVTIAAILAGVAIAVAQNKAVPCLGVLQAAFGIDMARAGWLSSVFSVMGVLAAVPAAVLTERLGPRNACLFSLGAAAAGTAVGLAAPSFPILLLSRVLEGMGAGIITVAVPTIIARYFPPEKRGLPTGIWSSWQFVGQALCFFFGTAIAARFGWRGIWRAGLAFTGVAAVLGAAMIRMPGPEGDGSRPAPVQGSLGRAARHGPVQAICCAMFLFCFSCFGFVTWAPACWADTLGLGLERANQAISLFAILSIPAVLAVGWMIDRVDHRKIGRIACLGYGVMAGAAFLLPGPACMVPFTLLYPFFEGAASTSLWTIMPLTAKRAEDTAQAIALFNLASNCGMLIGPPAAGAIIQSFGWRAAALPILLAMAAGALCVHRARESVD